MTTQPDDPAFASFVEHERFNDFTGHYETDLIKMGGLTKREYFAAVFASGVVSRSYDHLRDSKEGMAHYIVTDAVKLADALIEELNKNVD